MVRDLDVEVWEELILEVKLFFELMMVVYVVMVD